MSVEFRPVLARAGCRAGALVDRKLRFFNSYGRFPSSLPGRSALIQSRIHLLNEIIAYGL
jgi:hypothetical protein